MVYRYTAVWGAHEGSLLLWALILAVWTAAVARFSQRLPQEVIARVLGVMGLVSVGFLAFLIFTSNPFERLLPAAARRPRPQPAAAGPGDDHPSADAVPGLRRVLGAVRVRDRRAARRPASTRAGCAGRGRGPTSPGRSSPSASRWARGGRTTNSAGAAGGSGIRSRTPASCRGSPAPRCCIRRR